MDVFDILNKEYGDKEKYVVTKYCGLNDSQYHVYEVKFLETGNTYERVRTSVTKGKLIDLKKKSDITKEKVKVKRKLIDSPINRADAVKTICGKLNVNEKTLVLDQATVNTGYAIIEKNIVLGMGFIKQEKTVSLSKRINLTKKEIREMVVKHGIKHIVLEDIFLSNNLHVYRALCSLIAVIVDMGIEDGLSITLVMASVWRKQYNISGNRLNCKKKAMNLVQTKFGFELTSTEEDLAEALLIAHFIMEENGTIKDMYDWK